MSASGAPASDGLFALVEVEVPWPLGPADGRYVLRDGPGAAGISRVIALATLGAAPRPPRGRWRRTPALVADPGPAPLRTGRATVVFTGAPAPALRDAAAARAWLAQAGEVELDAALRALARLLHAHRLAGADPCGHAVAASRLTAARAAYADGDAVAAGRWVQARELPTGDTGRAGSASRPRRRGSVTEGRLAALLSGRQAPLVCEELVLRARRDLDEDRPREAALQLLVALDAALAELPGDPQAAALAERIAELRARREAVARAAQHALSAEPAPASRQAVVDTVERLQAALRARAAAVR